MILYDTVYLNKEEGRLGGRRELERKGEQGRKTTHLFANCALQRFDLVVFRCQHRWLVLVLHCSELLSSALAKVWIVRVLVDLGARNFGSNTLCVRLVDFVLPLVVVVHVGQHRFAEISRLVPLEHTVYKLLRRQDAASIDVVALEEVLDRFADDL